MSDEEDEPEINYEYLDDLINKYDFIEFIYISDYDGVKIAKANKKNLKEEVLKKCRNLLPNYFTSCLKLIGKSGRWPTKNIISFYDNYILYQVKISNTSLFAYFICNKINYNHEIIKEIINELKEKLEKIDKELENAKNLLEKE